MTPRAPKPWTKTIEESGVAVRVYERESGSLLYREVRLDERNDRKSLGHHDRVLAEQQAQELSRRLAELRLTGHTGAVTFGQLTPLPAASPRAARRGPRRSGARVHPGVHRVPRRPLPRRGLLAVARLPIISTAPHSRAPRPAAEHRRPRRAGR